MLDQAYVRQLFNYSPETGLLTWRVSPSQNVKAGEPAGGIRDKNRSFVSVKSREYPVGRIIWLWMTGNWPSGFVDHCDRNPQNNRWTNLRDVTQRVNNQNRSVNKNCTSGVPGVCWLPSHQKWGAKIGKKHLGYFVELTAAVAARKQAESTLWNLPKGG